MRRQSVLRHPILCRAPAIAAAAALTFAALFLLAFATTASAAPSPIATMPDDAIVKAWPGARPSFRMGRFSSDGSQLALVAEQLAGASDQVWLYDMRTKHLLALTEAPKRKGLTIEIKDIVWGTDDALYIAGDRDMQDGHGVANFQLAGKAAKVSPVVVLPKDVAAMFAYDARPDIGEGDNFQRTYENAKYVVTVRDVRHPFYRLSAKRKGGKRIVLIANGTGALAGFLFDKQRSLVRYINDTNNSIVTYDLNTGKSQTLLSIGPTEALLDTTADGTLLAFERFGPCDAVTNANSTARYSVCFLGLAP